MTRPPPWDRLLAHLALGALWFYRRCLSRFTGRTCLFHPSCSARSVALFRERGFVRGLADTRAQLFDCYPQYSLSFGAGGRALLIARSGRAFPEHELASSVLEHLPGIPPR